VNDELAWEKDDRSSVSGWSVAGLWVAALLVAASSAAELWAFVLLVAVSSAAELWVSVLSVSASSVAELWVFEKQTGEPLDGLAQEEWSPQ